MPETDERKVRKPGCEMRSLDRPGPCRYHCVMSDAASPRGADDNARVKVVPIDEALRTAKPLPPPGEINIEGLTDDEWDAFMRALTEQ